MKKADWYFDFISPYAYFGLLQHHALSEQLEICYRPVLLAGLLNHWEQKGPAEIPGKREWTYRWCAWWAAQNGIPFRFPAVHPFNSLPYLRLAIAAGNRVAAIELIFKALWTTGVDPMDPEVVIRLARELKIDPLQLSAPAVKDALRHETEQAMARNIFGVPTLMVEDQLFWGADATDFVRAYLADPTIIETEEMRRIATLPVGVSRKQT